MKSNVHGQDVLRSGIRTTAVVFVTAIVFSLFINLLMFRQPPVYAADIRPRHHQPQ